jgi:predicted outer membrane repeat protein
VKTSPSAFVRPRTTRIASVASVGALVGLSLFAAAPANAVTSADCNSGNTVNANAATPGTVADIQTLLDAHTAIICLIGKFTVPSSLSPKAEVTFYGDPSATLTGTGIDRMIDSLSDVTVENLTFIGGRGSDIGGAIYSDDTVTAINSTFDDNITGFSGGAIFGYSVVNVESSTFVDNSATNGGGVASGDGTASVSDSTFTDNSASDTAGAVYAFTGITVDGSTFDGNTSVNGGGAIQSGSSASTVRNSTFTHNTGSAAGGFGGALRLQGGTITQSTFLDNTDHDTDSGQSIATNVPVTLLGNIFASSTPLTPQVVTAGGGSFVDGGGNVFSTTKAIETFITPSASSKFGESVASIFPSASLGHNGGPTETVAIGAESAARGVVTSGTLSVDQRGKPRKAPADAGAFEYIAPASTGPALPITGVDPTWLASIAAALIAAGALAFGAGRRQLRRRTSRS